MSDASSLKQRIEQDMKDAMRSKAKERLGTIRLILAAIKQREVDERITLDDTQVLAVLDKMLKQRRDSIEQYRSAARDDLADKEQAELELIQQYLPTPLSDAELDALLDDAIATTGAGSIKEMGQVMSAVRAKVQGRADMRAVSERIKSKLSS